QTLGRPGEARTQVQAAITALRLLAAEKPGTPEYQDGLAQGYHNLAFVLESAGFIHDAETLYREAIAIRAKLAAAHPRGLDFGNGLGGRDNTRSRVLASSGDPDGAAESLHQAIPIQTRLMAEQPDVLEYQARLATSYHNLAALQEAPPKDRSG